MPAGRAPAGLSAMPLGGPVGRQGARGCAGRLAGAPAAVGVVRGGWREARRRPLERGGRPPATPAAAARAAVRLVCTPCRRCRGHASARGVRECGGIRSAGKNVMSRWGGPLSMCGALALAVSGAPHSGTHSFTPLWVCGGAQWRAAGPCWRAQHQRLGGARRGGVIEAQTRLYRLECWWPRAPARHPRPRPRAARPR